jgi:hypothetical protein
MRFISMTKYSNAAITQMSVKKLLKNPGNYVIIKLPHYLI